MKRFFAALSLCVMLFWAVPAFGEQKTSLPSVVEGVVLNRDFFSRAGVLWGYEDCFLHDVNRLNDERIGVVLISPSGFEIRLVYDVNTLNVLYLDTLLPKKSSREAMRRESVSVADVVKLAKRVVEYLTINKLTWKSFVGRPN